MLEKFLISIGLKQPEYVEEIAPENTRTVRPSTENRFSSDDYTGDLKIHQPKDEVEFISDAKMRIIHKDGVYLIIPSNMSLPSSERERLQSLGLYKINV